MFGVDSTELLIVAVAALLFIGPKDLPQAMRAVGRWVGKVRGMARHFSAGIEAVIREAELEEMERKWREDNERIMRDHPEVEAGTAAEAQAYLGMSAALPAEEQAELPLAAPAAPEDDPRPPGQRELP